VYSRLRLAGTEPPAQPYQFIVSGRLWAGALVLLEPETDSLFALRTGEGIRGPLRGKRLINVPSILRSYGEWKSEHPDTGVVIGEGPEPVDEAPES
jgi:hypothetical protein